MDTTTIQSGLDLMGSNSQILKNISEQLATLSTQFLTVKKQGELSLRLVGTKRPRPEK
jgi:hypothetical protein